MRNRKVDALYLALLSLVTYEEASNSEILYNPPVA